MSNDYIPAKEKDFHEWQSIAVLYARENATRFGIADTVLAPVTTKKGLYEQAYAVSEDPATRTSAAILARQEARMNYDGVLRPFFKSHIIYNEKVTDEDRRIMGLTVHDTKPTPVPVPKKEPEVTYTVVAPATLEFHFRDKDETGRGKSYGIHGIEFCFGLLDTPPVDWSELPHSKFFTKSPARVSFNGHERSKTVYFAARWENTRGEKGPWTDILSTIVP
jgi:hypothetical protein